MSYRVDLHTHSYGSPDGALRTEDYRQLLESGALDYVAVTDHDRIDIAQQIKSELGGLAPRLIVGAEITTSDGELIGLYLKEEVPAGQTAKETAQLIHEQGGIVYVPHPFETVRSGIPEAVLDSIPSHVDIVETYNGRAVFQDKGGYADQWATKHGKAKAASSDAHGRAGWGRTHTTVDETPNKDSLVAALASGAQTRRRVGIGILYPKLNRLRKTFKKP